MLTAWRDLFEDKKFWTAKLAVIAVLASKSLGGDTQTFWAITAIFVSLIVAQAIAEHGQSRPVTAVAAVAASTPVAPTAPTAPTAAVAAVAASTPVAPTAAEPPAPTDAAVIVGGVVSAVAGGVTAAIAGGL